MFDAQGAQTNRLCLGHAVGPDRHLRARCPSCGAQAILPAKSWVERREGGVSLDALGARMRCLCGGRWARMEVWHGPEPEAASLGQARIWRFV